MRDQLPYIFAYTVLTLTLTGVILQADARKLKLPKSCAGPKHAGTSETTLFSTPDADQDVLPVFVGKRGQPMTTDMEPRLPGFEHARLLSNLTEDQKKRIRDLQTDLNMRIQSMQEHINNLNAQLDVAKGHPQSTIKIQNQTLPAAPDLKNEIAGLRKSIQQKRKESTQLLEAILTEEQRDQIKRMRRGEMLRELPEPSK